MVRSSHVGYIIFTSWSRYYELEMLNFLQAQSFWDEETSVKKRVGCNGRSQKLKICSVSKVVEINTIMYLFLEGWGVMYNKTI